MVSMRQAFEAGETRSYLFRRQQLLALQTAIYKYEEEIYTALYQDLKKGREEAYATEIGLLLTELRITLKHLRSWTRSTKVKTNLLNFPSSSKIVRDPLGVVFIIAPWNYPIQLLLMPLIGAIAGGNAVVLKPSELAPACARRDRLRAAPGPAHGHPSPDGLRPPDTAPGIRPAGVTANRRRCRGWP